MNKMISFNSLTYSQLLDSVKPRRQQQMLDDCSAPNKPFMLSHLKIGKIVEAKHVRAGRRRAVKSHPLDTQNRCSHGLKAAALACTVLYKQVPEQLVVNRAEAHGTLPVPLNCRLLMDSGKGELLSLVLYALPYLPLSNGFFQLQGHTEGPNQNLRDTNTKI